MIDVNLTGHRPVCYGPVCYSTVFTMFLIYYKFLR